RDRVRYPAGGTGLRAPPDRGTPAPLQPAQPPAGEGALDQADPRALAPAVPGPPGARRQGLLSRPVHLASRRGGLPRRPAPDLPGSRMQPAAAPEPTSDALRARRDASLSVALRRQRRHRRLRGHGGPAA